MATRVQNRRGSTAEHSTFTGAVGEVTVDTDKEVVVVHDGTTAGGYPQMRENGSQNLVTTGSITGGRFIPTSSTVPTNGVYLPAANSVAISTGGTQKLAIDSSGNVSLTGPNLSIGGAAPSNAGYSNLYVNNTSGAQLFLSVNGSNSRVIYSTATDLNYYISDSSPHIWFTNAGERMRLDASGRLGIGTSEPNGLKLGFGLSTSQKNGIDYVISSPYSYTDIWGAGLTGGWAGQIRFWTSNNATPSTPSMTLNESGRLGIGTTNPQEELHIVTASQPYIQVQSTGGVTGSAYYGYNSSAGSASIESTGSIRFAIPGSEAARIDSSGRLLVGTSSTSVATTAILQGSSAGSTADAELKLARGVNNPGDGATLSALAFSDSSHTNSAVIYASRDGGTWSASSKPTRLVFSTTADGASSPTERLRIDSRGYLTALGMYNNTTAAAANVHVSSAGGELFRSTSSIKYKTDVETIQDSYSEALLNCRPVWYRSTCEGDNANWGWWGFIAEEVAEIDPRLVHWKTTEVTYDEKGAAIQTPCDPEPESVQYDRFVPHLLNLVKRQQQAIETLEAKVAALESA